MTDPIYNEDVRQFIADRYEALGHANRLMRELHDARERGMYTSRHTTAVRDEIAKYLELHFEDDEALPDLSEWDGDNTPQRVYSAAGGDGFVFWLNYDDSGTATSTIIDKNGSGYTRPPTLSVVLAEGEPGSGLDLRAVMGEVSGCSITDEGDDYTSAPTVTISAPDDDDGTRATMGVYRGKVTSVSITAGGTGYDDGATLSIGAPDSGSDNATADLTVEDGVITGVELTHPGSGYTSSPVSATVANSTGGSGATFDLSIDASVIAGCYIIEKGAGYLTTPTVSMSGGGGTGAAFDLLIDTGIVKDIEIVDGGSGYSTDPYPTETVTLTLPGAPASTDAQLEDAGYVPEGWSPAPQVPNDTDAREVYRSERTGRIDLWGEWGTPTVYDTYEAPE